MPYQLAAYKFISHKNNFWQKFDLRDNFHLLRGETSTDCLVVLAPGNND